MANGLHPEHNAGLQAAAQEQTAVQAQHVGFRERLATNFNEHRKLILGMGLAACAIAGPVVAYEVSHSGSPTEAAAKDQAAKKAEVAQERRSLINLLTVRESGDSCADIAQKAGTERTYTINGVTRVRANIGAEHSVGRGKNQRRWSDALSTPFRTHNPEKATLELEAAICADPILGETFADVFKHMQVSGINVVDLNPWLKAAPSEDSQINDKAAKYVTSTESVESASAAEQTKMLHNAVTKWGSYEEFAEKLNTLISRFDNTGIHKQKSNYSFHLKDGGLVAGALPEVGKDHKNDPYGSFILVIDQKTGGCQLVRLGVNEYDKRPVIFPTPTCRVVKTTPHTPNTPNTPNQPPKTPHHPPTETTPPSTTTPPETTPPGTTTPPETTPPGTTYPQKTDPNTNPGGVPGEPTGIPTPPETSEPQPGTSPGNVPTQPQETTPAPVSTAADTRPADPPAETGQDTGAGQPASTAQGADPTATGDPGVPQ